MQETTMSMGEQVRSAMSDQNLLERLVRIEVQLENLVRLRADENVSEATIRHDFEERLRRLEKTIWMASGAAAAVGGLLGSLFPIG